MLVVEDTLLLITATSRPKGTYLGLIAAAGLLTDLALAGNVRVTERGESTRHDRVVLVPDAARPTDDLLSQALVTLSAKEQWRGPALLEKLAKGLPDRVYQRLVRAELVTRVEHRVLGIFPAQRWEVIDSRRAEELLSRLDQVFTVGTTPDLRLACLGALLHAGRRLQPALDRAGKVDRRRPREIGKQLVKQHWPARALHKAIEAREFMMMAS